MGRSQSKIIGAVSRRKFELSVSRRVASRLSTAMPRSGKSRTVGQRLQSLGNLLNISRKDQENTQLGSASIGSHSVAGSSSHNTKLADLLEKEQKRGNAFKRKLHNVQRKLVRSTRSQAQSRADALEAQKELSVTQAELNRTLDANERLKRDKNALRMCRDRVPEQLERAVDQSKQVSMKEKGVFTDRAREMVRELASCNVPIARVNDVVQAVSKGVGVEITDTIDKHSVSRIVLEGKLASDMQIVHEVHEARSMSHIDLNNNLPQLTIFRCHT